MNDPGPTAKAKTENNTIEEIPPTEAPLQEIEPVPAVETEVPIEEVAEEPEPAPSLSDKEIKTLMKLLEESTKDLETISDNLTQINTIQQDLSKQKEKTREQVDSTSQSVSKKTEKLIKNLLAPEKDVTKELQTAKNEIPKIINLIDHVDLEAVKIKKEITNSQKKSKKLAGEQEKITKKLIVIEKYLSQTPPDQMIKEK